jgi:hypothetical protein
MKPRLWLFWVMHLVLRSMRTCIQASHAVNMQPNQTVLLFLSLLLAAPALQLCAALHGWHGPELLPLAVALQQLHAAQQQQAHQRKPGAVVSQPVLRLLRGGLLPAVGRADEVAGSNCVRAGTYKAALRSLMRDDALLQALPQDVVRSLALTYWYQVGGVRPWSRQTACMVLLNHARKHWGVHVALLRC